MTQETETILRRSLNAVDQQRKRLTWLSVIAGLTIAWELYRLLQVQSTGDVPKMIVAAVFALFFWILGMVVVIVFQIALATKRVLRAIELASKPAE
jgi:formate/nitrite transporter FocA (FNT family)